MGEILKCYNTNSFGDSFVYMTHEEIEKITEKHNLKILHHITSDGNPLLRCKNFIGCGLHNLVFFTAILIYINYLINIYL